jgi:hypothetical protein
MVTLKSAVMLLAEIDVPATVKRPDSRASEVSYVLRVTYAEDDESTYEKLVGPLERNESVETPSIYGNRNTAPFQVDALAKAIAPVLLLGPSFKGRVFAIWRVSALNVNAPRWIGRILVTSGRIVARNEFLAAVRPMRFSDCALTVPLMSSC